MLVEFVSVTSQLKGGNRNKKNAEIYILERHDAPHVDQ
jgi:hypothetical protein